MRAVASTQVFANRPVQMIFSLPYRLSWCSRSVFGKPLEAQCSVATMSPARTWKSSWNVPPQLFLAKACRSAAPS
jgi:hypothetical protein